MQVTSQDMLACYDSKMIVRLSFDDGQQHFETELDESPVLNAALSAATGALETALSVGGNYSPEQLNSLTPNSLALAKRIICSVAFVYLSSRRGSENTEYLKAIREESENYLDRLRGGERIFVLDNSTAKQSAGQASLVAPGAEALILMNGIAARANPYFGGVKQRLPIQPYR